MFYLEDKLYTYPSKSVLEDIITREGPADENSFSPFVGCRHLVREQFLGKWEGRFNLSDFLLYWSGQDFEPKKVNKETEDTDDDEIGDSAEKVNAGFTTLESVDEQDYAEQFATRCIIGYKKNADSPLRRNEIKDVEYFRDEESEEMISPAELYVKQETVDIDTHLEIQRKFPYLLKVLHNGSIFYGIHLLSFMRAYEIVRKMNRWQPQDFGQQGVYKMNRDGHIGRVFVHAEDNKVPDYYPFGRRWAAGEFPTDMYYKAAQESLSICSMLNIDITRENVLDYDKEYIDSIVCTYVANNEEYVESYGYVDPAILSALSPDNIFRNRNVLKGNDTEKDLVAKSTNTLAELLNLNLDVIKYDNPTLFEKERLASVNELLSVIAEKTNSTKFKVDDFTLERNLFVGPSGNYVLVPATVLGNWPLEVDGKGGYRKPKKVAAITYSGLLVIVEEVSDKISYLSCADATKILRGETNAKQWSTVRL